MNRRQFIAGSTAGIALLQAQTSEDGFVPMFDGKTLNGWSIREGPDSAFYVHDA